MHCLQLTVNVYAKYVQLFLIKVCVYIYLTLYMLMYYSRNVTQLLAWFALTVCIVSIVNLSWYVSAVDGSPQSYHANNFTPCLLQYLAPGEQQRANWVFLAYWKIIKCNWIRDNRDDWSVIKKRSRYSRKFLHIMHYIICSWAWLEICNGKPHLQLSIAWQDLELESVFSFDHLQSRYICYRRSVNKLLISITW